MRSFEEEFKDFIRRFGFLVIHELVQQGVMPDSPEARDAASDVVQSAIAMLRDQPEAGNEAGALARMLQSDLSSMSDNPNRTERRSESVTEPDEQQSVGSVSEVSDEPMEDDLAFFDYDAAVNAAALNQQSSVQRVLQSSRSQLVGRSNRTLPQMIDYGNDGQTQLQTFGPWYPATGVYGASALPEAGSEPSPSTHPPIQPHRAVGSIPQPALHPSWNATGMEGHAGQFPTYPIWVGGPEEPSEEEHSDPLVASSEQYTNWLFEPSSSRRAHGGA